MRDNQLVLNKLCDNTVIPSQPLLAPLLTPLPHLRPPQHTSPLLIPPTKMQFLVDIHSHRPIVFYSLFLTVIDVDRENRIIIYLHGEIYTIKR